MNAAPRNQMANKPMVETGTGTPFVSSMINPESASAMQAKIAGADPTGNTPYNPAGFLGSVFQNQAMAPATKSAGVNLEDPDRNPATVGVAVTKATEPLNAKIKDLEAQLEEAKKKAATPAPTNFIPAHQPAPRNPGNFRASRGHRTGLKQNREY